MRSFPAIIRTHRWTLLLAFAGVLLIRWWMRHDAPERLIDLPEGAILAIQSGQLIIDQRDTRIEDSQPVLISVDAVSGATRPLPHEQNQLVSFYQPRTSPFNLMYAKPWLYSVVMSGPPKRIARADGQRAISIPPLILRREHVQTGTTEDLLQFTCTDDVYIPPTFDPQMVHVRPLTLQLVKNTFYWIASSPSPLPSERIFLEGRPEPLSHACSLMCKSLDDTPARSIVNWQPGSQVNFAVQDDRLYWTDGKPNEDQRSKDGKQWIHSLGHTSLWTRRLPDGPPQQLAANLHGVKLMPTSLGLYVDEILPTADQNLSSSRTLYFDLNNHSHLITLMPSLDARAYDVQLIGSFVDYHGRVYTGLSLANNSPGHRGEFTGCLLSMRPDGSDQKQLVPPPASNRIMTGMEGPVVYRDSLYATAEWKIEYFDGQPPTPMLTRLDTTPTEHLQTLPHASEVAGTYFDEDYCYYVVSEKQKTWRNWLSDPGTIPTRKVLYRYRLPDRGKSQGQH